MRRIERRLRTLERASRGSQPFLIVYQDTEQPDRYRGRPREGQTAEQVYTEQHLESLAAKFTVIVVRYGEQPLR